MNDSVASFAVTEPVKTMRLLRLAMDPLPPPSLVGQRLGRYAILAELGVGGTAHVYRAFDEVLKREVALKILLSNIEAPDWLRQEAEYHASVAHPNIVQVYHFDEYDGIPCLAMELVDGGPLQTPAASHRQAAQIALTIAVAMGFAHNRGIFHCDLKPSNVLIERNTGHVRVSDFGHAIRTEFVGETGLRGTPEYMAPEVWRGEPISVASDVWSEGVMLYEMLTGSLPFGQRDADLRRRVLEDAPPPLLGVDPDLAAVCRRCLEKEPSRRYADHRALAEDLQSFLEGREVSARPLGHAERWFRRIKRHRFIALAIALTVTALVIGIVGAVRGAQAETDRARAEAARAQAETARAQAEAERTRTTLAGAAKELKDIVSKKLDHLRDAVRSEGQTNRDVLITAVAKGDRQKAEDACNRIHKSEGADFSGWLLFNAQGILVGRSGDNKNVGKSYAFRDYYKGAKDLHQAYLSRRDKELQAYVSRAYRSEADGKAEVGVSFALSGKDDQLIGVLVAEVRTGSTFGNISLPDQDGVVMELLALSDHERGHEAEDYPAPVFILKNDLDMGETKPDEATYDAYNAKVPDTPFTVRVHLRPHPGK